MEDSVKDLDSDINPTNPEPRFSIGGIFYLLRTTCRPICKQTA